MSDFQDMRTLEGVFTQFKNELKNLQGEVLTAASGDLTAEINRILREEKCRHLAIPDSFILGKLLKPEDFENEFSGKIHWIPSQKQAGGTEKERTQIEMADAALEIADYLLAQTGTIIFTGRHRPINLLTMLPSLLIVIATKKMLLPDLWSWHKILARSKAAQEADHSTVYLTGPSRTADIEKKLVIGVHGPHKLYVLFLDENKNLQNGV